MIISQYEINDEQMHSDMWVFIVYWYLKEHRTTYDNCM